MTYDFSGDGRFKRTPPAGALGHPIAVTNAHARLIIEHFKKHGLSSHSAAGNTLWVILDYCEANGVPYQLTSYPKLGYEVKRLAPFGTETDVLVMTEREEALIEALRALCRALEGTPHLDIIALERWEDAEKLLEKYDES